MLLTGQEVHIGVSEVLIVWLRAILRQRASRLVNNIFIFFPQENKSQILQQIRPGSQARFTEFRLLMH